MNASDDDLYQKYRAGNRRAFDELYERFRQPLYNYVRKSVNPDRVDELYQDIWLKVVASANSKRENYQDRARFRQWLFTCAHNLIVDEYRKNARADLVEFSEIATEDQISDEQIAAALNLAIGQLPLEQRQAFHLRHELGCSVAEIAEIQACPVESAKSRLRYAYQKLKGELKEFAS